MWINVAKAIAGLTVTRAIGADGKEINPVADTTDGIISCAAFFLSLSRPDSRQAPGPIYVHSRTAHPAGHPARVGRDCRRPLSGPVYCLIHEMKGGVYAER